MPAERIRRLPDVENGHPAASREVALKLGRLFRCSSVTFRTTFTNLQCDLSLCNMKMARDAPSCPVVYPSANTYQL